MNVLIVGGAGYIGSHVVLEILLSHHVVVFDNLSTGHRSNIPESVPLIEGDIQDQGSLIQAMKDHSIDVVIHLAALKAAGESMSVPEIYSQANINGTIQVLNAMVEAGVPKIVFSSTAAVFGSPQYLPIDEAHPTRPENFYGYTKLAIEELFTWYSQLKGIQFASLRYFNAAGYDVQGRIQGLEQNPANLLPVIMEVAQGTREEVLVFGDDYPTRDGSGVRDYIHVNDLASGHLKAIEYLNTHEESLTVNLGTGVGVSVLEMIQMTQSVTQAPIKYKIVGRRAGDPAELYASSQQALDLLDWQTQYSDLKTIVESTWNAYQANK